MNETDRLLPGLSPVGRHVLTLIAQHGDAGMPVSDAATWTGDYCRKLIASIALGLATVSGDRKTGVRCTITPSGRKALERQP